MTLGPFLVLYFLPGAGVAIAVYLSAASATASRGVHAFLALFFWPMFLPMLLCGVQRSQEAREAKATPQANDELALLITQVDTELQGAWQSLDGWAEDVLAREKDRLSELRRVWWTQAERIREMDRLLSVLPSDPMPSTPSAGVLTQRLQMSHSVIEQNRERLRQIRERTYQDLLSSLAWVRELVSMIHVAKFTGAPASRAEELIANVAAAVEGLSAMNWNHEEPFLEANPNAAREA